MSAIDGIAERRARHETFGSCSKADTSQIRGAQLELLDSDHHGVGSCQRLYPRFGEAGLFHPHHAILACVIKSLASLDPTVPGVFLQSAMVSATGGPIVRLVRSLLRGDSQSPSNCTLSRRVPGVLVQRKWFGGVGNCFTSAPAASIGASSDGRFSGLVLLVELRTEADLLRRRYA